MKYYYKPIEPGIYTNLGFVPNKTNIVVLIPVKYKYSANLYFVLALGILILLGLYVLASNAELVNNFLSNLIQLFIEGLYKVL